MRRICLSEDIGEKTERRKMLVVWFGNIAGANLAQRRPDWVSPSGGASITKSRQTFDSLAVWSWSGPRGLGDFVEFDET